MFLDRFQAIGAAGGCEATPGTEHRRNEAAVEADQRQHQPGHSPTEPLRKGGGRLAG